MQINQTRNLINSKKQREREKENEKAKKLIGKKRKASRYLYTHRLRIEQEE